MDVGIDEKSARVRDTDMDLGIQSLRDRRRWTVAQSVHIKRDGHRHWHTVCTLCTRCETDAVNDTLCAHRETDIVIVTKSARKRRGAHDSDVGEKYIVQIEGAYRDCHWNHLFHIECHLRGMTEVCAWQAEPQTNDTRTRKLAACLHC